ncbi:MAG: hypothetical protein LBS48_04680 [Treponema sp.]|jgi:hypothetical protein|nr:hypothetical protein [Treponema sp.]
MATKTAKTVPQAVEFSSTLNQLEDIINSFDPRFKTLAPEFKKAKSKVGIKRRGFLETAHRIAQKNTEYAPAFFDIQEFDRIMAAMKDLMKLRNAELTLNGYIRNAETIINNEAYNLALSIYRYLREAAKSGKTGAKSLYDGLKKQFPNTKRSAHAETQAKEAADKDNA